MVSQGGGHQIIEVAVVGEKDMAAKVPRETPVIDDGTRQASRLIRRLVQDPVVMPVLFQTPGRAQTRGARADDDDSGVSGHGARTVGKSTSDEGLSRRT